LQLSIFLVFLIFCTACQSSSEQENHENEDVAPLTTSQLADSIRYFRRNFQQTDFLSRQVPNLDRQQAFAIQLEMLKQELAGGATLAGWKMGGTATADEASFDPVFGYILDRYLVSQDSIVDSDHFPGGSMLVEGEIGFIIKNDLKDGVASKEALMDQIDQVIGAVEFAQGIAVPLGEGPLDLNYVIATGMGQVGTIKGTTGVRPQEFDLEKETVRCYINGELAAEGTATNIFGNPLNALYELANLLPTHNQYLKAGDVVITGSLYQNPTITGPADVRLEFSTLGSIAFKSK
jgi:2-keto-4-pentenoate hydratase